MLLRPIAITVAIALALSSALANYEYIHHMGKSFVLLVCTAEIAKFIAPLVMRELHASNRLPELLGVALLWTAIIVFSCTNSFGNAVTKKAAMLQQRQNIAVSKSRHPSQIAREIAQLPAVDCTPQTKVQKYLVGEGRKKKSVSQVVQVPLSPVCATKTALAKEMELAQKEDANRANAINDDTTLAIQGDPVSEGIITLASQFGLYVRPERAAMLVIITSVALQEFGAAFGVLLIPPFPGTPSHKRANVLRAVRTPRPRVWPRTKQGGK